MRLSKIRDIISYNLPKITLDIEALSSSNFRLKNARSARQAIENLSEIKGLTDAAMNVLGSLPSSKDNSPILLSSDVSTTLQKLNNILVARASLAKELLSSAIEPPKEGTIYFKLPQTEDLGEFKKNVSVFEKSVSQIFSGHSGAPTIKFIGVESGSDWLVFFVTTKEGLKIVLDVFKGILEVGTLIKKMEKEIMELRKIEAETELIKSQVALNKQKREHLKLVSAEKLLKMYGENPKLPDFTEDIQRYKNALDGILTLVEQGADIDVPEITFNAETKLSTELKNNSEQLSNEKREILLLESSENKRPD